MAGPRGPKKDELKEGRLGAGVTLIRRLLHNITGEGRSLFFNSMSLFEHLAGARKLFRASSSEQATDRIWIIQLV